VVLSKVYVAQTCERLVVLSKVYVAQTCVRLVVLSKACRSSPDPTSRVGHDHIYAACMGYIWQKNHKYTVINSVYIHSSGQL